MQGHLHLGSPRIRARAWLHQLELDRALAAGADMYASPELTARAAQLQSVRFKRHLLVALDAVLARAERPAHWHSTSLPVRSEDVLGAADDLARLREALREYPRHIPVRALAQASCLLDDPHGPLYQRPDGAVTLSELAQLAAVACAQGSTPTHHP